MGERLARDEATAMEIPLWLARKALADGTWPLEMWEQGWVDRDPRVTLRERVLLANLIRARKGLEMAQAQLDSVIEMGAPLSKDAVRAHYEAMLAEARREQGTTQPDQPDQ